MFFAVKMLTLMKLNGERDEAGVDVGAGGASAGAGAKVTFSIK